MNAGLIKWGPRVWLCVCLLSPSHPAAAEIKRSDRKKAKFITHMQILKPFICFLLRVFWMCCGIRGVFRYRKVNERVLCHWRGSQLNANEDCLSAYSVINERLCAVISWWMHTYSHSYHKPMIVLTATMRTGLASLASLGVLTPSASFSQPSNVQDVTFSLLGKSKMLKSKEGDAQCCPANICSWMETIWLSVVGLNSERD